MQRVVRFRMMHSSPAKPPFPFLCSFLDGLVSTPLTSVNLLRNDIGEAAADVVRAAEQHGKIQTLCGIKPDQKEADFSGQYLEAADAVLLAYDIKVNAPLKTLNLYWNKIGVEGAKAIAAALPRYDTACRALLNDALFAF